ncbi:hypothetical protein BN871_JH_00060 [Paenibacillus sp. P22]|nr:hypothetical protein BN871_JH_00060 [Paenibacillus sp. P22]
MPQPKSTIFSSRPSGSWSATSFTISRKRLIWRYLSCLSAFTRPSAVMMPSSTRNGAGAEPSSTRFFMRSWEAVPLSAIFAVAGFRSSAAFPFFVQQKLKIGLRRLEDRLAVMLLHEQDDARGRSFRVEIFMKHLGLVMALELVAEARLQLDRPDDRSRRDLVRASPQAAHRSLQKLSSLGCFAYRLLPGGRFLLLVHVIHNSFLNRIRQAGPRSGDRPARGPVRGSGLLVQWSGLLVSRTVRLSYAVFLENRKKLKPGNSSRSEPLIVLKQQPAVKRLVLSRRQLPVLLKLEHQILGEGIASPLLHPAGCQPLRIRGQLVGSKRFKLAFGFFVRIRRDPFRAHQGQPHEQMERFDTEHEGGGLLSKLQQQVRFLAKQDGKHLQLGMVRIPAARQHGDEILVGQAAQQARVEPELLLQQLLDRLERLRMPPFFFEPKHGPGYLSELFDHPHDIIPLEHESLPSRRRNIQPGCLFAGREAFPHPVLDRFRQFIRSFHHPHMPAVFQHDRAGAAAARGEHPLRRNDAVLGSGNEQHGQLRLLHDMAAAGTGFHAERYGSGALRRRAVADLLRPFGKLGLGPLGREQLRHKAIHEGLDAVRAQCRSRLVAPGLRFGAVRQRRGVDQRESLQEGCMSFGKSKSRITSERMAQHDSRPGFQRIQEGSDILRKLLHAEHRFPGSRRTAVAAQIRRQHPISFFQDREHLLPIGGASAEAVQKNKHILSRCASIVSIGQLRSVAQRQLAGCKRSVGHLRSFLSFAL